MKNSLVKFNLARRVLLASALAICFAAPATAGDKVLDSIHFLIPGGAGGGWDGTARGTGEALTKAGSVGNASYENMSGGGGGKAIGYLIENAESNHDTLMVNSCLLYTSPSPRDGLLSRMPSSA